MTLYNVRTDTISVGDGTIKTADTLGIVGHNLTGCTVKVQTSPDDAAWTDVAEFTIEDNSFFAKPLSQAAAGYWRVEITGAAEAPSIGVLILGNRLEMPRFPKGSFVPESESTKATVNQAKNTAHILGVIEEATVITVKANFTHPGADFVRQQFRPFYKANRRSPFIFAWDTDEWPEMVIFARFDKHYSPTFDVKSRVSKLPINMIGTNE